MVIFLFNVDEKPYEIVKKTRVSNVAREMSSLNVSDVAAEKVQRALNLLGMAILETASAGAIYNQRKTIMEQDVDVALDAFYNYLDVFDKIFNEDDEQNDTYFV